MKSISTARVNYILSLCDSGKDDYAAASFADVSPSTISRIHKKHWFGITRYATFVDKRTVTNPMISPHF